MEDNLDPDLRKEFLNGGFVVRQTNHFWTGISPDRAIESTLMAGMSKF